MNKKGTLLHWIVFGLLAAVGIFFLLSVKATINLDKGANQLEFMEFYQEVKVVQLHFNELVQGVAIDSVLQLANQGGFKLYAENACGNYENYQLWNLRSNFCFPEKNRNYLTLFSENFENSKEILITNNSKLLNKSYTYYRNPGSSLTRQLLVTIPDLQYRELQYLGKDFSARSNEVIKYGTSDGKFKYTEDASFTLNFGYDLNEEYQLLETEAVQLLERCRNREILKSCLDSEKLDNWHYTDCNVENYSSSARKIKFCATSPNNVKVYDYGEGLVPIEYKFALDFSSAKPFTVEDIEVYYDTYFEFYEITFESNDLHDEVGVYYFIYLTEDPVAVDYSGSAYDFEHLYHTSANYLQKIEISALDVIEECPISKSFGEAYLCPEEGVSKLIYLIDASYLDPTVTYYVTVTIEQAGDESDIARFVSVS